MAKFHKGDLLPQKGRGIFRFALIVEVKEEDYQLYADNGPNSYYGLYTLPISHVDRYYELYTSIFREN